jgi:branched-chain amino acid transport system ATP-binding protein
MRCIIGPNGAGKTTLISMISGHETPTAGEVWFKGRNITGWPVGRGVFPRLTVRENLIMGRIAAGRARNKQRSRIDEVVYYFPQLKERLGQLAGSLSGGEQQMLAIGRGLMTDPKVMLLDEPSEGIMPVLVQQIARILADISRNEGMTLIVVEQNVPVVFALTDHCVILEKGRIVSEGSKEDVARSEVMQAYLAV